MKHNYSSEKQRVATLSLLASGGLAIAKFAAALLSGSLGLLSEAFHSLMDFFATALTLVAVRVSGKPADDDHHYGHAKAESLVALIEAGMLVAVALWVAYEAIKRLWQGGHEIEISWWLFAIIIASIVIDFNRARALKRTAEKTSSDALAADALHFSADMWSSIAVLIGLTLVWLGYPYADSLAALVVSVFVAHAAWDLGKNTLNNLLDAAPAGVASEIQSLAETANGVLSIRQLRVRPAGQVLYIDLTVDVARNTAGARLESLRQDLVKHISDKFENADTTIQLNPVELDSESAFDKVAHIADTHDLKVHHLIVQSLNGRLAVSFDVEMPARMTIADAHDRTTALECEIREGLGADVEVESHVEPMQPNLLDGDTPPVAVITKVEKKLQAMARKEKALSDLHNVRVRSNSAGLYVHYHCRFAPELSIAAVHEISDRIEVALMAALPNLKRVVAHAEPIGAGPHQL